MDLPVCLRGHRVGTLTVDGEGRDTALTARCTAPAGLYRLYAVGEAGETLLGVTEDGCLRRRFSPALLTPAGRLLRGELRPAAEAQPLPRLPQEAEVRRLPGGTEVWLPYREDAPFPLTALFCFARVERGRVCYRFDGQGRPVMPEK